MPWCFEINYNTEPSVIYIVFFRRFLFIQANKNNNHSEISRKINSIISTCNIDAIHDKGIQYFSKGIKTHIYYDIHKLHAFLDSETGIISKGRLLTASCLCLILYTKHGCVFFEQNIGFSEYVLHGQYEF